MPTSRRTFASRPSSTERIVQGSAARVLADIARALDGLRLRWYVFGAQAAIVYGHARLTADVDVTVEAGAVSATALVAALDAQGVGPRVRLDDAFVARTRVLPLLHRATTMDVDVVLAGPGLEERFLADAVRVDVAGVSVPFASATDLVVMKILAARPKDLDDVVALLRLRPPSLDVAETRALLAELEAALDQADLIPALDSAIRAAGRGSAARPRRKPR